MREWLPPYTAPFLLKGSSKCQNHFPPPPEPPLESSYSFLERKVMCLSRQRENPEGAGTRPGGSPSCPGVKSGRR